MERRDFVKTSAIIGASSMLPRFSFAAAKGSDRIKVGLIGCGGRGSGATCNMMVADQNIKIVAMADLFEDKLLKGKNKIANFAKKFDNSKEIFDPDKVKTFTGWDCVDNLLKEDVDVVIEATTPVFRTPHYAKIVAAGKHAFLEKPPCVDAVQARQMLELSDLVKFAKFIPLEDENQRSMSDAFVFVEKTAPADDPAAEDASEDGQNANEQNKEDKK